jgi:transposase-like protein
VWSEISTRLLLGLRALLETRLEDEMGAPLGAHRHEQTQVQRNGHYTRDLPPLLEGGMGFPPGGSGRGTPTRWLHHFSFPKDFWRTIRTNNILEWAFRELRRRTRPMGVFTNAQSAQRILYGVTQPLKGNWQELPLGNFKRTTWRDH